ncbi:hypothetical protein KIN_02670 [Litoreibacter roseus]|uniref:Uncharacterized protein n=1 Tax=Litoreibacter roseus TaxID=2601869 RepID=A0A6N6JAC6_9RHOB|nr:hypothetical protein KIN_02670 [Litoreibacter roseus]
MDRGLHVWRSVIIVWRFAAPGIVFGRLAVSLRQNGPINFYKNLKCFAARPIAGDPEAALQTSADPSEGRDVSPTN